MGDFPAELNYVKQQYAPIYEYVYQRTQEQIEASNHAPDVGYESVAAPVLIRDARGGGFTLDDHSFELFTAPTKLSTSDFLSGDSERIVAPYYAEIADLMKRATGAAHVIVFQHKVRTSASSQDKGVADQTNTHVPYARGPAHADYGSLSSEMLFKRLLSSLPDELRAKYSRGRFVVLNAWRNISDTPIVNNHLAVCDQNSLLAPDDYLTGVYHVHPSLTITNQRLSVRNSSRHRWYYYSAMAKDEVLLFKQYDSDLDCRARMCFHSSVLNPAAPQLPARMTIEARALAFLPDHSPDTCPDLDMLPALVDFGGSGGGSALAFLSAEGAVGSVLDHLQRAPETLSLEQQRELLAALASGGGEEGGVAALVRCIVEEAAFGWFDGQKMGEGRRKDVTRQLLAQAAAGSSEEEEAKDGDGTVGAAEEDGSVSRSFRTILQDIVPVLEANVAGQIQEGE